MNKKYFMILFVIIFVVLLNILVYKFDKTNCEKNGGIYIWSLNKYETKCHLRWNNE